MVRLAQGPLGRAAAYAWLRKQPGRQIAESAGAQLELARTETDMESAWLLLYNAARLEEFGQPFGVEAAMAKYQASQLAETVASRSGEFLGGLA